MGRPFGEPVAFTRRVVDLLPAHCANKDIVPLVNTAAVSSAWAISLCDGQGCLRRIIRHERAIAYPAVLRFQVSDACTVIRTQVSNVCTLAWRDDKRSLQRSVRAAYRATDNLGGLD